jgi:hypothetical protein
VREPTVGFGDLRCRRMHDADWLGHSAKCLISESWVFQGNVLETFLRFRYLRFLLSGPGQYLKYFLNLYIETWVILVYDFGDAEQNPDIFGDNSRHSRQLQTTPDNSRQFQTIPDNSRQFQTTPDNSRH